jgi:hypothetical protein
MHSFAVFTYASVLSELAVILSSKEKGALDASAPFSGPTFFVLRLEFQ